VYCVWKSKYPPRYDSFGEAFSQASNIKISKAGEDGRYVRDVNERLGSVLRVGVCSTMFFDLRRWLWTALLGLGHESALFACFVHMARLRCSLDAGDDRGFSFEIGIGGGAAVSQEPCAWSSLDGICEGSSVCETGGQQEAPPWLGSEHVVLVDQQLRLISSKELIMTMCQWVTGELNAIERSVVELALTLYSKEWQCACNAKIDTPYFTLSRITGQSARARPHVLYDLNHTSSDPNPVRCGSHETRLSTMIEK
jgi:hypothetical protein